MNNPTTTFIKYSFFGIIYLVALALSAQMFTIAFSVLCFYALFGKEQAIKALSIIAISKYLNPALYAFSPETGILAWLGFFIASLRIIISSISNFIKIIPLVVFSIVVLMLTVLFSVNPDISLMKLVMFTFGAAAVILGFTSLDEKQGKRITIWFFALFFVIVLLSLPTFAFPNIAYNRNGQGFQGILNHPQSFGPFLAPISTWILARLLFEKGKNQIVYTAIVLLLLVLMTLSQARTSLAAVLVSLIVFFVMLQFKRKRFKGVYLGRTIFVGLFMGLCLLVAVSTSSVVQEKLTSFVYKRESSNIDEALSSRSGGIASQWNYFLASPLVGNGFCVYAWGGLPMGVSYYKGIPISAPVEKGFLPTAILEEIGLLGSSFFMFFLWSLFRICVNNANVKYVCMFICLIAINAGEVFVFSMGGIGLFYWLLIGVTILPTKAK